MQNVATNNSKPKQIEKREKNLNKSKNAKSAKKKIRTTTNKIT